MDIKKLYEKYKDIILYGFFGGLTTIVNIVVYWLFAVPFNCSTAVSNAVAWLIAVIFAFVTNKLYVFNSKSTELSLVLKELFSFIAFRVLSGVIDMAIMVTFIDYLGCNKLLIKILSNIIVIIINYVASKLVIFRKREASASGSEKQVDSAIKDWQKVTIITSNEGIEPVTGRLYRLGIAGAEIEDEKEFNEFLESNRECWDYVDDGLRDKMKHDTRVSCYITNDANGAEQLAAIKETMNELKSLDSDKKFGSLEILLENVSEEDWANSWKQFFKPITIGDKILIKPLWEDDPENREGRIIFNVDPGMVFGTGTHETTKLCIEAAEKYIKSGDNVLDLGCGSGILSIISLLLGAGQATAADIDPKALDIAYANAERNGIDKSRYNVLIGNIVTDKDLQDKIGYNKYDVVFANIVADVIIALAPLVTKQIKKDGVFIVSGIITERSDEVTEALKQNGFDIIEKNIENGWVDIICKLSQTENN